MPLAGEGVHFGVFIQWNGIQKNELGVISQIYF